MTLSRSLHKIDSFDENLTSYRTIPPFTKEKTGDMQISGSPSSMTILKMVVEDILRAGRFSGNVEKISGAICHEREITPLAKRAVNIYTKLEGIYPCLLMNGINLSGDGDLRCYIGHKAFIEHLHKSQVDILKLKFISERDSLSVAGRWFEGSDAHIILVPKEMEDQIRNRLEAVKSAAVERQLCPYIIQGINRIEIDIA